MKAIPIITAIAVSFAMAMPVAAHHMCLDISVSCPEEIGDEMGGHEAAIENLDVMRDEVDPMGLNTQEEMDPADSKGGPDELEEYFGAGPLGTGSILEE